MPGLGPGASSHSNGWSLSGWGCCARPLPRSLWWGHRPVPAPARSMLATPEPPFQPAPLAISACFAEGRSPLMTDETEVRALTGVFGTCAELTRTCIVAKQIPITPQAQPFQCPEKQGRDKAKENICCFKLCEIQKKTQRISKTFSFPCVAFRAAPGYGWFLCPVGDVLR